MREREDAAFYESMRFILQECIDNYDDGSDEPDETTATARKKKREKNSLS
jgi:hypothetical protein